MIMRRLLLFLKGIATALLLLTSLEGHAQFQTCGECTRSNQDKTLQSVFLGDVNGTPLPSTYQCTLGETNKVYLYATFGGNPTRYSLYVQFRLLIDEEVDRDFGKCFFPLSLIPTGTPVLIDEIEWECGAEVKLADFFMSWQVNDKEPCSCTSYHGCYQAAEAIVAKAPLVARMDYTASCEPGNAAQSVVFEDNSTGGTYYKVGEPYSYLWNFGAAADYTITEGTPASSLVKVKWLTPGLKAVSLTVTDSTLVSDVVTRNINITACFHLTAAAQPGTFECSNAAGLATWLATAGGATTSGQTGSVTWTYAPYTLAGGCASYTGTATVLFTGTDGAGSTVTTSALLTITDTTVPAITTQAAPQTVECDGAGNTTAYTTWLNTHAGAAATDNCDATLSWSYEAGNWTTTCGNAKNIPVTFYATDDCGNKSAGTTAVFTIEDKTVPVISTPAAGKTVECDGSGNVAEYNAWLTAHANAVASDVCGGTLTWSYTEGTWSDGCGLTKAISVTFFATDGCGNKSAGTTATFTIRDTTKPTFSCPANINKPADLGQTYATVTIAVPTVNEACGTVTLVNNKTGTSNASGQYPLGPTLVTYTATDECGNVQTCSFTVTVSDDQAPGLTCPPAITTGVECIDELPGKYASLAAFLTAGGAATDNQGIDPNSFDLVSQTSDNNSCPEIITRVYTISDTDGNSATCSQTITIDDVTPPAFTTAPASKTVVCDGDGNPNDLGLWLASAVATDNCGTPVVTHNYGEGNMLSNGCGATGAVTVIWTATDACGNEKTTSATFTIVDTTVPDFVVPANMTIQADENCEFDADPVKLESEPTGLTDNCADAADLIVTYSDVLSKGPNPGEQLVTRTWTVTDPCGNKTSKVQVITVLGGNAPPELVLHEICVYLTKYGKYTLNSTDIRQMTEGTTANCGATTDLTFTISPRSFECKDVFAKVPVTVTAKDFNGNTATGTTYVLVMDTISPVALCKDTTVYLDKYGQAFVFQSMVNPGDDRESTPDWAKHFNDLEGGSYDNCGIAEMYLSRQLFTCADLGSPKQVTLTVIDPSGNDASCKAMITVLDTIKPVITPVANLTVTVEPGVCTSKINYPQIIVKDNCGVLLERTTGLGADGMFPLGTTTETWKASNVGEPILSSALPSHSTPTTVHLR